MAVRTGALLKGTDAAGVESALDGLIATPSQANFDALITACNTVIANGMDSRHTVSTSDGRRDVGQGLARAAKDIKSDAQAVHRGLPVDGTGAKVFTGTASVWTKLKARRTTRHPWHTYRTVATTD